MSQLFQFSLIFWAFLFFHHQSILAEQIEENVNELEYNVNPPAQYSNFYGKNSELFHTRKKRFLDPITWTVGTIVLLVVWSGFLAPFIQAQISLKINIFGWFLDDEGCIKRMKRNKFKSFCKPTKEELFVREFIHQANMKIFNKISKETAELLQYEHSRTVQNYEPPANPEHSLSERESLFLTLFKNRLIPYGHVKISKWLLADEDKNSQNLYKNFNRIWLKLPDKDACEKRREEWNKKEWNKIKKNKKEWKDEKEKEKFEDLFFELLKCECIRMQGDWTMTNEPIIVDTVKNCRELLLLKKVPEKEENNENEENINAKNIDKEEEKEEEEEKFYDAPFEFENPEDKEIIEKIEEKIKEVKRIVKENEIENEGKREKIKEEEEKNKIRRANPKEKGLIRKIAEEINGGKRIINKKEIVDEGKKGEEERNKIRRAKLWNILADFLSQFDVKEKQIEFLQILEENLLGIQKESNLLAKSASKISSWAKKFSSAILATIGRSKAVNYGEDLEEAQPAENQDQCRIIYENYGEDYLIGLNQNLKRLDLRKEKLGNEPKNFIKLFEKTFELAREKFEKNKWPNTLNIREYKNYIGERHLYITLRRIPCRIYEFAEEINEKNKKKIAGLKMAKKVLKQFGKLCTKLCEKNLKERTELLAIEGFQELDKNGRKIDDEILDKIELENYQHYMDMDAEIENMHSKNVKNSRILPINNENRRHSEELKRNGWEGLLTKIFRRKRSNKYYNENGEEENKIAINKTGLVRRKRLALPLALLSFAASLVFLQVYLRFFAKKYDPITWLWMCMKYPRSHCQIPEAIRNENEFLESAKENAYVEMPLETVVDIRQLYEMYLPSLLKINLKKVKENWMRPSQFFAAYSVKLNRRHQILLDCYYYVWDEKEKNKPKNLDNLLAPIIEANKKYCTLFVGFMENEKIPNKLKHNSTHCSQIGGRVN